MKGLFIVIVLVLGFISCKKNAELEKKYSLSLSYGIDDKVYDFEGNEPFYIEEIDDLIFHFFNGTALNINMQPANSNLEFYTNFDDRKGSGMKIGFKVERDTLLLDSTYKRFKSYEDFKSVFTLGVHSFSDYGNFEGVSIRYWKNGAHWFSDKKFGNNQTVLNHSDFYNSTFEITHVEKFFSYYKAKDVVRVYANFEVTLYNNQSDSLRIEDGSFVMLFGQ